MAATPITVRPVTKVLLTVLAKQIAVLAVVGWLVSQPGWGRGSLSPMTVDPQRLKAHVVALSETFYPRSWRDRANLGRTEGGGG